ncbi:hypothetical protein GCM10027093_41690 [Paraburkholderia jirisanensis]
MNRVSVTRAIGLLAVAALTACANSPDRRYATQRGLSDDMPSINLDVSSTTAASDSAGSVAMKDLPERAEAAYIRALAAKTKSAAELHAELSKDVKPSGSSIDHTSLSRSLIFTLYPTSYHPADRVVFYTIKVIPDIGVTFSGITAASTTWGTQTIDTLDVSTTNQFQPELDLTLAGYVQGSAKGPVSSTHQTDVKSTNVEPFLAPTANLMNGNLSVVAVGARGISLYGTTVVKLKLSPSADNAGNLTQAFVVTTQKLTDVASGPLKPEAASLELGIASGLKGIRFGATTCLTYELRHVGGTGEQTYREDDDDATYVASRTIARHAWLTGVDESRIPIWRVFLDGERVLAVNTGQGMEQLGFQSVDDAEAFTIWLGSLKGKSVSAIGGRSVGAWRKDHTESDTDPLPVGSKRRYTVVPFNYPVKQQGEPKQSILDQTCSESRAQWPTP